MKPLATLVLLSMLFYAHSAIAASECMMTALHDTHAIEDPSSIWKRGERDGPVTQLQIDKRTGTRSFCIHGGYCYLALANLNGRALEALPLVNCQIRPGDKGDDDGTTIIYEVVGRPARTPSATNTSEVVTDIKTVRGECTVSSYTAIGPIGEDLTRVSGRFPCNGAAFFFHDTQNKRVTIRFLDSDHMKDAGMLGFTGVMQSDGQTLDVTGLHYMDPKGPAWSVVAGCQCQLEFAEQHISFIQCHAEHRSRGNRYLAFVAFAPAPGQ